MAKTLLVTGSSGLIGSEVCAYFARELGYTVHGVDNNQRAVFFGPQGDTRWNQQRLQEDLPGFQHHELDIRDRAGVLALIRQLKPSVLVHTAAQPSHDRAAAIPFDDFDTNAVGTLNLLEAMRQACPESPFVHMSTNKVYGDAPNAIALRELATRWDYADPAYAHGIPETFTIDQSKHSLFGASKVAADVMVQEYGRYFNLPCCCLRGGCLTGPNHSGVELHGFLSYLVKCNLEGREYKVFGYKGKQVRDNIHSLDVARFMGAFVAAPRAGEVYNLGGGKANSTSILEAFKLTEKFSGRPQIFTYLDQNRAGDHICYYSDLRKMRDHYPTWDLTQSLEDTIRQIVEAWRAKLGKGFRVKPSLAVLILGFGAALTGRAQGPATLAKDSPFSDRVQPTAGARPAEPVQLTGVSVSPAGARLCLYDTSTRHSRWVAVGATVDGLQVISYDDAQKQAVIALHGERHTLTLQEWQTAAGAAASPEARAREARLLSGDLLDIGLQQRQAAAAQKSAGN